MLAIKHKIDAGRGPLAANDQHEIAPQLTTASVVPAVFATAAAVNHPAAPVGVEPTVAPDWLQDWTNVWTGMAATFVASTAASLEAASAMTTSAGATGSRPNTVDTEVSLWSRPVRSSQPRSWYRPPQPNLLDPTAWGFPAPLSVYGVPVTPQMAMYCNPLRSPMAMFGQPSMMDGWFGAGWSGLGLPSGGSFGMPFLQPSPFANPFARQPENVFTPWLAGFAPQLVNPWASLAKTLFAAPAPLAYATYRSDSGHAVAQIIEPTAKTAAAQDAAQAAVIALINLFAWPTPLRAN